MVTRTSKYLAAIAGEVAGLYLLAWLLLGQAGLRLPDLPILHRAGVAALLLAIIQTMICAICWGIRHQIYRGPRYACRHARLVYAIRRALLQAAGYGIEEREGDDKVVVLPRIKVTLDNDLAGGAVRIHGHIKFDAKLETLDLSSALGRYIVEEQYMSDDSNWHIYTIIDSQINNQMVFGSYAELADYARQCGDYMLYMDRRSCVPLSSLLLVGATGSGKTYALYSLILQMQNWTIKPRLYFADPKISSLLVLGERISPEYTAGEVEDMIGQLEVFCAEMVKRKHELREKLKEKLDADYRHWQITPHVLIFDEFAGFQRVVATMDKATKDRVAMYLRNIVLQGRQLGFFLWIVMQKSGADDIPTAIRDNLPWKVVLGLASDTTYQTAFEASADLPKRLFHPGQGLYTYQGLTRGPKITSFPTLNFDILDAVEKAPPRHVMTGGPRKNPQKRGCKNARTSGWHRRVYIGSAFHRDTGCYGLVGRDG